MLMHYKTPFEAILLAQQSQQCNSLLVPPLSVLSRLKKTVDDLAHEDRMLILNRQEFHSPVKVLLLQKFMFGYVLLSLIIYEYTKLN